ncbi:helix-turn-helix domain-containing protein [Sphingomonas glacialis]|uniref:Helix-turn-helix domain-containing protein n=1 Tax=Sphingomonas glacialis TaxID=658225 RepID=A0A502G5F1_9SPHN|nr:helix-turn-helix domain-containing protein [Sphingomonas glacialis]TPG56630.1 helix-turn-helix domain-containing protein [Sphingomonas glacialis]
MTEPIPADEPKLFPKTAGDTLREAREAQGLSLAEVAARTRIPVRQLEAIETGNYAALPSITYSVGFAKAYARAVGVDEVAIAREVRGASDQPSAKRTNYEAYEIDEPSRVPPRGLAITALLIAVVVVIGAVLFYGTTLFRGDGEPVSTPATESANTIAAAPVAAPSPSVPSGAVVLTATDEVWLRIYDKANTTLHLGTMKAGESYTVPADAVGPMINVGRPDKLQVTVGGTAVAPLGDGKRAIKDVPLDAAALTARGTAPVAGATPSAAAGPTARREETRSTRTRSATSAPASLQPLNIAAPAAVAPEPAAPAAAPPAAP